MGHICPPPKKIHHSFPSAAALEGGSERFCTGRAKILRLLLLEGFKEQKAVQTKIIVSLYKYISSIQEIETRCYMLPLNFLPLQIKWGRDTTHRQCLRSIIFCPFRLYFSGLFRLTYFRTFLCKVFALQKNLFSLLFFPKQITDYQDFIYLCVSQFSDFFPSVLQNSLKFIRKTGNFLTVVSFPETGISCIFLYKLVLSHYYAFLKAPSLLQSVIL